MIKRIEPIYIFTFEISLSTMVSISGLDKVLDET